MKLSFCIIAFLSLFCVSARAQFNNIYQTDQSPQGTSFAIEENSSTGQYNVPILYFNPELETNCLGVMNITPSGDLDNLKLLSTFSSPFFYGSVQSFIKASGGDFFLGGNFDDTLFLKRLDQNLETIWSNSEFAAASHFWGGGELPNGDLVIGLAEENPSNYYTLRANRYSETGEFTNFFNIELDYDFSRPTTFIIDDSLLYVSFSRILINQYRRNYIVCYNAITGEEIWETHQIENGEALGFTDGLMCMTADGQLKLVYVEQTGPDNPGMFHSGWLGYFKVVTIDAQTGQMYNESTLSELETQSYVVDVAATDDGGLAFLFWAINPEDETSASFGIMKLDSDMNLEWRRHYIQPIDLEVYENASHLKDIETTSDDCIVAVGDAMGTYFETQISIQYPWVLKVDACGNEMVSDCALSGVGEISGADKISIYPNPAHDRIYLKGKNTIKHVSIYDLQGKIVHDESFSGSLEQTLFIDHLTPGLYLVQATDQTGTITTSKVTIY